MVADTESIHNSIFLTGEIVVWFVMELFVPRYNMLRERPAKAGDTTLPCMQDTRLLGSITYVSCSSHYIAAWPITTAAAAMLCCMLLRCTAACCCHYYIALPLSCSGEVVNVLYNRLRRLHMLR